MAALKEAVGQSDNPARAHVRMLARVVFQRPGAAYF